MKKIAFYLESIGSYGGVNKTTSIIASTLSKTNDYEVHIISRYKGDKSTFPLYNKVKLHQLFPEFISKFISFPIEIFKLRKIIKQEKIDIFISTGAVFFVLAYFSNSKIKHIDWEHPSVHQGNIIRKLSFRFLVNRVSSVVVLVKESLDFFHKIRIDNVIKIYNPFPLQDTPINNTNKKRQIISCGVLHKIKGFDLLLDIWKKIPSSLKEEWNLLIVGGEDKGGEEYNNLQKQIKENNLKNVYLLGFRHDVLQLMSESSIFAMTSRAEGLPMVLLEAQSVGLPLISFDCKTGPAEIITPENGILIRENNIDEYAKQLEKLMLDKDLRQKMGANALKNIERFSLDKIICQWKDLLNSL